MRIDTGKISVFRAKMLLLSVIIAAGLFVYLIYRIYNGMCVLT